MNLANEGLEARKKEEEINSRKRKAEEDKTWEGTLYSSLSLSSDANTYATSHRHPRTTCRQLAILCEWQEEKEKQGANSWVIFTPHLPFSTTLSIPLVPVLGCHPSTSTHQHRPQYRSFIFINLHLYLTYVSCTVSYYRLYNLPLPLFIIFRFLNLDLMIPMSMSMSVRCSVPIFHKSDKARRFASLFHIITLLPATVTIVPAMIQLRIRSTFMYIIKILITRSARSVESGLWYYCGISTHPIVLHGG
jgi:hypothetical protein